MNKRAYFWLDVFTDQPLSGNPLAVVLDAQGLSTKTMQAIAREFNLSETTFVLPPQNPENTCQVRIFTPSKELPFAGHPSLGTAWAIRKAWALKTETFLLEEGIGTVPIRIFEDGSLELKINQSNTYRPLNITKEELATGLGISAEAIGWEGREPEVVTCGLSYSLVPIADLESIEKANYGWSLDHPLLKSEPALQELYLVCPQTHDPQAHFHVRLFAPGAGIAEDPATGSAAATLGAWQLKYTQEQGPWCLEQGLEMGRPSKLWLRLDSSSICVRGQVVAVSEGWLHI
jgi:trans-2,3-dihydro-3-hydroxyanthranilate isomerase